MPLTLVQRQTAVTSSASASLTATYSPTPVQGNLLVACGATNSPLTMTSSGWTLADSATNTIGLFQWWKIAGASESTTVVVTPGSNSEMALVIEEWSNYTPSPIDKTAKLAVQGTTTTPVSGTTAVTAQADERAIAMFACRSSSSYTAYTNSYVEVASLLGGGATPVRLGVAEVDLIAAATTNTTATGPSSNTHSGMVVTYKAEPLVVAPPNRMRRWQ